MLFKNGKKKIIREHHLALIQNNQEMYQLQNEIFDYKQMLNNLTNILSLHGECLILDLYEVDGYIFYTVIIQPKQHLDDNCSIITFKIGCHKFKCISHIELSIVEDYSSGKVFLEIVELDTFEHFREGHASKIIGHTKEYAKRIGAECIVGDLYQDTYIGLENLKSFYAKNGFKLSKTKIFMKVIEDTNERI